jgi:hypothetical protein
MVSDQRLLEPSSLNLQESAKLVVNEFLDCVQPSIQIFEDIVNVLDAH